jgi:RNA polymerase sigma factor (sigma-70 family)
MRPDELQRIAHDPGTFEAFYREHVEGVQQFVVRRVADAHLAADLTAEVFLAAIDAAPSYRAERGEPAAWLFGIARNVVSAEHRRAARERRAHGRIEGRRLLEPDDVARMQERIDAAARARELHAALAELPEGERAVFELTALDGMTPAQAAAVLGIRPVTARVRLHRARAALRTRLFDDDRHATTRPMEARP